MQGLGVVLLQERKVVPYASTKLNAMQQIYAQIQRELQCLVERNSIIING